MYRTRRAKSKMIETVAKLRAEGKVVGAIADELGLSDRTVRDYLGKSRRPKKCVAIPETMRPFTVRNEEPRG